MVSIMAYKEKAMNLFSTEHTEYLFLGTTNIHPRLMLKVGGGGGGGGRPNICLQRLVFQIPCSTTMQN